MTQLGSGRSDTSLTKNASAFPLPNIILSSEQQEKICLDEYTSEHVINEKIRTNVGASSSLTNLLMFSHIFVWSSDKTLAWECPDGLRSSSLAMLLMDKLGAQVVLSVNTDSNEMDATYALMLLLESAYFRLYYLFRQYWPC